MNMLKRMAPLALLGALLACSNSTYGSNGSGCTPSASQVCMVMTQFSPTSRTVAAGTTVTWINGDGITHTTTSSSVPATASNWSITVAAGTNTSMKLTVPGTYQYYCTIHGSPGAGMHGTIIVN
ncbi:MAG TPA: plastocyanin/azurin family copper-binding protein [Gemmatimonadales bacterium]|nr:plastocyanin/azurin family copper-binding protein [Gemmatimonadales bacterium]